MSGLCKNDKKEKGMGKKNRKVKHTIKIAKLCRAKKGCWFGMIYYFTTVIVYLQILLSW